VRLALDTNRYRDLADGDLQVRVMLESVDAILVPFVVVAELRAGFAMGKRGVRNEGVLQRFLAEEGIGVVYAREETTRLYATLYRQLRSQGTPIPTNDLWIAALVVEHRLTLCSRDRHFDYLPQITRV
jgi:tRNA(fMet)-specific endonuclease VapC